MNSAAHKLVAQCHQAAATAAAKISGTSEALKLLAAWVESTEARLKKLEEKHGA